MLSRFFFEQPPEHITLSFVITEVPMTRHKLFFFICTFLLVCSHRAQARTLIIEGKLDGTVTVKKNVTFTVEKPLNKFMYQFSVPSVYNSSGNIQRLDDFNVTASPEPAESKELTDKFGNRSRKMIWRNLTSDVQLSIIYTTGISATISPRTSRSPFPLRDVPESEKLFLQKSKLVQSEAPQVRELAAKLTKGAATEHQAVSAILTYAADAIKYQYNPKEFDALYGLTTGTGNCQNFSHLSIALLRASGIPARVSIGQALKDKWKIPIDNRGSSLVNGIGEGLHAWIEVWYPDLGWLPCDPQQSRLFTSTRHIKFGHGLDADDILEYWSGAPFVPRMTESFEAKYSKDTIDIKLREALAQPSAYIVAGPVSSKALVVAKNDPPVKAVAPVPVPVAIPIPIPIPIPISVPIPVSLPKRDSSTQYKKAEPVAPPPAPAKPVPPSPKPLAKPVKETPKPIVAAVPSKPTPKPLPEPVKEAAKPIVVPEPVKPLPVPPKPLPAPVKEVPKPIVVPEPVKPLHETELPAAADQEESSDDFEPTYQPLLTVLPKPVPPKLKPGTPVEIGNMDFPALTPTDRVDGTIGQRSFDRETAEYATSQYLYAQAFTLDNPITISDASLAMRKFGGDGSVFLDIVQDVDGKPSLSGIRSMPVSLDKITRRPGYYWVDFSIPDSARLAPGKYWMILRHSGEVIMNWFCTPGKRINGPDDSRSTAQGWQWEDVLTGEFVYRVRGVVTSDAQ